MEYQQDTNSAPVVKLAVSLVSSVFMLMQMSIKLDMNNLDFPFLQL